MGKIAVLLPGIGYTVDRSLLYYAGRIALSEGYEVIPVPYTGFQKGIKGNADKMRAAFLHAFDETEKILTPQLIERELLYKRHSGADVPGGFGAAGSRVLFISKSIGTAVAAAYEQKHGLKGQNVYYTPLAGTFRFIEKGGPGSDGIVFHGTADPWAPDEEIIRPCEELKLALTLVPDANHSLETGDVLTDVSRLREIMAKTAGYIH